MVMYTLFSFRVTFISTYIQSHFVPVDCYRQICLGLYFRGMIYIYYDTYFIVISMVVCEEGIVDCNFKLYIVHL